MEKKLTYEQLSDEAKEVLSGMVEFCLDHSYCMGMDEGVNLETDIEHPFVTELRAFIA